MRKVLNSILLVLVISAMMLTACAPAAPAPTATQPPTAVPTKVPPTNTALPPTATKVPPTNTPVPPTATAVPPTKTPPPPPICNKLATAFTPAAGQLGSADKPYTITFIPSGDTGGITKAGTGIADCLTKMTGNSFKIEVGTTFTASVEALGAGKAQFSFLNTVSAIMAAQKYGVTPIILAMRKYATNAVDPDKADEGKMLPIYKGQFITKVGSGITKVSDLKGKTFCFVDAASASGNILPRIMMAGNGVNPDKDLKAVTFAGSHPNVAIAVYKGDCDAGVTFVNVLTDTATNLKATYPDIADKVTVFAVTDKIPNDGMQIAKGVDTKVKDLVVEGMLAMAADPGGIAMLTSLYNYNALQKVDSTVYDTFVKYLKDSGFDITQYVK